MKCKYKYCDEEFSPTIARNGIKKVYCSAECGVNDRGNRQKIGKMGKSALKNKLMRMKNNANIDDLSNEE